MESISDRNFSRVKGGGLAQLGAHRQLQTETRPFFWINFYQEPAFERATAPVAEAHD